jgi:hypothetical protein
MAEHEDDRPEDWFSFLFRTHEHFFRVWKHTTDLTLSR